MDVSNVASIHQQKSKYRKFKQPFPPAAYSHPVPRGSWSVRHPRACRLLDVWGYVKQQGAGGAIPSSHLVLTSRGPSQGGTTTPSGAGSSGRFDGEKLPVTYGDETPDVDLARCMMSGGTYQATS
jgi:hypothetical protein